MTTLESSTMQSDDVLAFLENHPDFLQHHAERFGLKHASERVVVSLVDRQMLDLKDRARQLEARLQQLIRHGEANDLIQARTHQLSLCLMAATSLESAVHGVKTCFARDFGLDRMALRLWHPKAEAQAELYNNRNEVTSLTRNLSAPYCGPYVNDEILSWLPPVPVLQSFCQVALRDDHGEVFGLLVLASDDAERFTFDMHTHYLAQMGELIATTLSRILDSM